MYGRNNWENQLDRQTALATGYRAQIMELQKKLRECSELMQAADIAGKDSLARIAALQLENNQLKQQLKEKEMPGRLTPLHKDDTELLRMRCMGLSTAALLVLNFLEEGTIQLPVSIGQPFADRINAGIAELRELDACVTVTIAGRGHVALTEYGARMVKKLNTFVNQFNTATTDYEKCKKQVN